jgi:hypothetical protein
VPVPYTGGYGWSPSTGGYSGSPGSYASGGIDPLTGQPTYGGGGGYPLYGSNPYFGGYPLSGSNLYVGGNNFGTSQAQLDTPKKQADTLANHYSSTQEQADMAKKLLERLQAMPTAIEVVTGKSLNVILQALSKFTSKQLRLETVTLDENMLKSLNVTGSNANLGLLRNDGQIPWATVFDNTTVLPSQQRADIDNYAKILFCQAANNAGGKLDPNVLTDLELAAGQLRKRLNKNINVVGTQSYLEGSRFLDHFDGGVLALRKGDVVLYLDFIQKFAKGGKTVAELVEYVSKNGLTFAPAMPGDERAYHALQAAQSAQSLGLQVAMASAGNQ